MVSFSPSLLFGLIYLGSRGSTLKYFLSVGLHLAIHILPLINPCYFVRLLFPFPNALIHALPRIIANAMLNSLHLLLFWEVHESRHLEKETTVEQNNTG